jgi:hypothetical protein
MFREMLIKGHNARAPHKGELWCNVLGEYLEPCMIGSFQFFPYHLGEDIMQKVFGLRSANELYSPGNGLLMDKRIRQYFYEFSIVIVPIGAPTDGCWRTVVLDKRLFSISNLYSTTTCQQACEVLDYSAQSKAFGHGTFSPMPLSTGLQLSENKHPVLWQVPLDTDDEGGHQPSRTNFLVGIS